MLLRNCGAACSARASQGCNRFIAYQSHLSAVPPYACSTLQLAANISSSSSSSSSSLSTAGHRKSHRLAAKASGAGGSIDDEEIDDEENSSIPQQGKPLRVERLLANLGYGKRKECTAMIKRKQLVYAATGQPAKVNRRWDEQPCPVIGAWVGCH